MIRIRELRQSLDADRDDLLRAAAKALRIEPQQIASLTLVRRSVDSRKKEDVHFRFTVDVQVRTDEDRLLKKCANPKIEKAADPVYSCPENRRVSLLRPVVVGFGPAGIFAALVLARAGLRPLVLERGEDVETRTADILRFFCDANAEHGIQRAVRRGRGGDIFRRKADHRDQAPLLPFCV